MADLIAFGYEGIRVNSATYERLSASAIANRRSIEDEAALILEAWNHHTLVTRSTTPAPLVTPIEDLTGTYSCTYRACGNIYQDKDALERHCFDQHGIYPDWVHTKRIPETIKTVDFACMKCVPTQWLTRLGIEEHLAESHRLVGVELVRRDWQ